MTQSIRVVLDTNVVLSSLIFRSGHARGVYDSWMKGEISPLVSKDIAQELVRVLSYPKFGLSQSDQEELLADYLPYAHTVRIPHPPPIVPPCRDEMDEPFMHLAVTGRAKVLVSGDQDLLSIAVEFKKLSGCAVLSLDAFCQTYCKG
ncbi:MAG: hypothetical protein RL307_1121 [Pseudomonadota bacterium]|jgi:putative PIN family toxin of toxin-antitoxin system